MTASSKHRPAKAAPLPASERRRFHAFAAARQRRGLVLLVFSMPLLFVVGWLRDFATMPAEASHRSLGLRLGISCALLAFAALMTARRLHRWSAAFGVAYALAFGTSIAVTSALEPSRLSLTHVAVMLTTIILLPHALRPAAAAATVAALCLPLFALLAWLGSPPGLWAAYAMFAATGVGIGLAYRASTLAMLREVYQLRRHMLERLHADALTNLGNRRGWQAQAGRAHRQLDDEGAPMSLVYFDLDRFKRINDLHGHAIGDEILRRVAAVMRAHLRPHDVVARVGGEEFVALLPGADAREAERIAERIRHEIEAMREPVPVTMSAGIAQARSGESLDALTERADVAMLEAKRGGRNRTVVA